MSPLLILYLIRTLHVSARCYETSDHSKNTFSGECKASLLLLFLSLPHTLNLGDLVRNSVNTTCGSNKSYTENIVFNMNELYGLNTFLNNH